MRVNAKIRTSRAAAPGLSRALARSSGKTGRSSRARLDVSGVGSSRALKSSGTPLYRQKDTSPARESYDLFSWAASNRQPDDAPRRRLKIAGNTRGANGRVLESRETGVGSRFGDYTLFSDLRLQQRRSKRENVQKNRVILLLIVGAAVLYSAVKIFSRI